MITNFASTAALDAPRVSPFDDDLMAFKFVKGKYLSKELELFSTKWFDYRLMTPFQATRHYIEHFTRIYSEFFRANFDRRAADHIKFLTVEKVMNGLGRDDPKVKKHFAALWRGRMCADMIGVPYDVYLNLAFDYRMRFWQRSYLPGPAHLFNIFDLEKIDRRWAEMCETTLHVAEHPAYLIQNYCGAKYQDDHHEWLMNLAEKRGTPGEFFARFINDNLLPIQKVRMRLAGNDFMMEQVERYLDS